MLRRALPRQASPTIDELQHDLRAGASSVVELVTTSLARIEEIDREVGAFTWLDPTALDRAEELDRERAAGRWRGPLHGIPVGIKELFDVTGAPVTGGSLVLPGKVAASDAEAVRRLRAAGAVVIGTTRTHEFAWGITTQNQRRGSTANPWDLDRVPGGSSGGSAAAVAAGMVPLALASDTGGSIRIPSAFCGVAGIKPSFGRISMAGAVALAPSLDTAGFMAANVRGLLGALLATCGVDPQDPATVRARLDPLIGDREALPTDRSLNGVRVGHSPALLELADATDRHRDYERALEMAARLGAEVVEVPAPMATEFRRAFATIQMGEAIAYHRDVLGTYPAMRDEYGPDVRGRLDHAAQLDLAAFLTATSEARLLDTALRAILDDVDVLLTPVATIAPPFSADPDTADVNGSLVPLRDAVMGHTTPQNLCGLPTVATPFGLSADGLPVGIQITAGPGAELTALRVAAALEALPQPE